jgi:hypothetical protein
MTVTITVHAEPAAEDGPTSNTRKTQIAVAGTSTSTRNLNPSNAPVRMQAIESKTISVRLVVRRPVVDGACEF